MAGCGGRSGCFGVLSPRFGWRAARMTRREGDRIHRSDPGLSGKVDTTWRRVDARCRRLAATPVKVAAACGTTAAACAGPDGFPGRSPQRPGSPLRRSLRPLLACRRVAANCCRIGEGFSTGAGLEFRAPLHGLLLQWPRSGDTFGPGPAPVRTGEIGSSRGALTADAGAKSSQQNEPRAPRGVVRCIFR